MSFFQVWSQFLNTSTQADQGSGKLVQIFLMVNMIIMLLCWCTNSKIPSLNPLIVVDDSLFYSNIITVWFYVDNLTRYIFHRITYIDILVVILVKKRKYFSWYHQSHWQTHSILCPWIPKYWKRKALNFSSSGIIIITMHIYIYIGMYL